MAKATATYRGVSINIIGSRHSIVGYFSVKGRYIRKQHFSVKIAGKDEDGELIEIKEVHLDSIVKEAAKTIDSVLGPEEPDPVAN